MIQSLQGHRLNPYHFPICQNLFASSWLKTVFLKADDTASPCEGFGNIGSEKEARRTWEWGAFSVYLLKEGRFPEKLLSDFIF